jgi:Ca-activated chloride channel family protein
MIMSVQSSGSLARASGGTGYAVVSIAAPRVERTHTRGQVNVAFVLDRSGSMDGEKFELARRAVDHALRLLRRTDRFSLVVYDSRIDVIVESTLATPEACAHARVRLASIEVRDRTDLCGGWLAGCKRVLPLIEGDGQGRCLLLTDGLANHGTVDRNVIVAIAGEVRRRGVVTSTFGLGADFDERLLRQMADAGSGHFYYIERAAQIPNLFASELGEALEVVAAGMTLTIETPELLRVEVLNEFATVSEPGLLTVQLGDLVSGQELSVVARFDFPNGQEGAAIAARFGIQAAGGQAPAQTVEQAWTLASDAACRAQPLNRPVEEAIGAMYAARARAKAVELNRRGEFAAAGQTLRAASERIQKHASESPALKQVVEYMQSAIGATSVPMSPRATKSMLFEAESTLRSRDAEGKARRSPK